MENRSPLKTIAWVLVLMLLPGIGIIFYVFFGQNLRKEKIIARKGLKNDELLSSMAMAQIGRLSDNDFKDSPRIHSKKHILRLLLNNSNAVITVGNRVTVLNNGSATFGEILTALREARSFIHMEYYIFANDNIGREIVNILKAKAAEGVEVRVIVDDVGSWELKRSFFDDLRAAGILIESFLQVRFPKFTSRVNYRNHRKIVIVDGLVGFLGGINVADRYLENNPEHGYWRDMHLKIEGDAVNPLQMVFLTDWYFVRQEELADSKYFPPKQPVGDSLVQITASGPDTDWPSIKMGVFQAIASAQKYVYIATPYFMPGETILMALKTAAMGGVDVRLLIPRKSDAIFTGYGSHSYVKELLEANVKVYFYKRGFLHSKMLVSDDVLSTIGSTNIDVRSFEQNFEVNAFMLDEKIAVELRQTFIDDLCNAKKIEYNAWISRPLIRKMKESFARVFSPLM
jgi:cardiolipin synthase